MYNLYNMIGATVEALKKAAFEEGYKQGLLRGQHDNVAHEKYQLEAYHKGRAAGFTAGFAAATGKSKEMEESHQQQKNGCGY